MQAAAITSRFLTGCSSNAGCPGAECVVSNHGLLHHFVTSQLIRTVHSRDLLLKLTNNVIQFAEQAFLRRDLDQLEEMSRILTNLPVDAARQIGLYYHALAINRRGQKEEAETLLRKIAESAPISYRARAIQTLGANYHDKCHLDEALKFQNEALRVASDKNAHGLQTMLMAQGDIAIARGVAGDHKGALAQFETLRSLVCQVAKRHPFYFYQYHNALAVELCEIGRIEEATAACSIALASPFAPAYPEWSETRDEIAAKRTAPTPSVVSINRAPEAPSSSRADATPSRQVESQQKPERSRGFVLSFPINDGSFQITITPIADVSAITGVVQSILEWMRVCIGPRAPPALA